MEFLTTVPVENKKSEIFHSTTEPAYLKTFPSTTILPENVPTSSTTCPPTVTNIDESGVPTTCEKEQNNTNNSSNPANYYALSFMSPACKCVRESLSIPKSYKYKPDHIDIIPSVNMNPIPPEVQEYIRERAKEEHKGQLPFKETNQKLKQKIEERKNDFEVRKHLKPKLFEKFVKHPLYKRMMQVLALEFIQEEKLWRNYEPNKHYRDTTSSRRRIQPEITVSFVEYAVRYGKKPWRHTGKGKIRTRIYDRLDWVDQPFHVEEEESRDIKKQSKINLS